MTIALIAVNVAAGAALTIAGFEYARAADAVQSVADDLREANRDLANARTQLDGEEQQLLELRAQDSAQQELLSSTDGFLK